MYKIIKNKIIFNDLYNDTTFYEIIESHNRICTIDSIVFGKEFNQDISLLPLYIKEIWFIKIIS